MSNIGVCNDTSEAVELFEPQGLYLKPIAKLNISVQLPQMKTPGKSISNWEVMEKLKKMVKPDQFLVLKVVKSTLDFVRFEGETENKAKLKVLIQRLDTKVIKLSGFPDALKVRAAEAKISFPSRHEWDSYFRDAKHMNEMKSGERPDTIHIKDIPSRWCANKKDQDKDKPSEYILRKVLETFGEIRCVDIPMLDPYRKEMVASHNKGTNIQTFSTFGSVGQDLTFEAFVQYKEYIGFVKAMMAFRGMKLMYKGHEGDDGKAYTASIKVDFDKTKQLTDKAIRKRRIEREKLVQLEKEREERVRREREDEERKREDERYRKEEEEREREWKRQEKIRKRQERRKEREYKRKSRRDDKRRKEEEREMQQRISLEERRILIAQRKLETIRLLSELFTRIKVVKQQEELARREKELEEAQQREVEEQKRTLVEQERKKLDTEIRRQDKLKRQEHELRNKILRNMRTMEERKAEKQREDLRKRISGTTRLRSAVIMRK